MSALKNSLQVTEKLGSQIVKDNSALAKSKRSTKMTVDMFVDHGFKWFNMVSPTTKGEVIGVGEVKKNENSFVNPMSAEEFFKLKYKIAMGLNPRYAYTLDRSAKTLTDSQKTMKAELNRNVSGRLSDYKKQLINRENLLTGSNGRQEKKTFKQSFVLNNNKMIEKLIGMEDATLDTSAIIKLLSQINVIVETNSAKKDH